MLGSRQKHGQEDLLDLKEHPFLDLSEVEVQEFRALGLFEYVDLSEPLYYHHSGNLCTLVMFSFVHDNLYDLKCMKLSFLS